MIRLMGAQFVFAAMLASGLGTAHAGQSNTAKIQANNLPPGVSARGMAAVTRTSDIGAEVIYCVVQGNNSSCTAPNDNSSVPKNIGNVACVPKTFNQPVLSSACSSLINAGSGNCQTNSAAGRCNSEFEWEFKPVCNYRTSSDSSTPAYWTWQLDASTISNNAITLDCSQSGFQGYTQD